MNDELRAVALTLVDVAELFCKVGARHTLPLTGKTWGYRRFWLGSMHHIVHRLDAVTYFVIERDSGIPIGIGPTKADAISLARDFLRRTGDTFDEMVSLAIAERDARRVAEKSNGPVIQLRAKRISTRRRTVFEKSNGHCHYCGCELALTGLWDVEHMTPRSKGGPDSIENLVAACRSCNVRKGSLTAEEFAAKRGHAQKK